MNELNNCFLLLLLVLGKDLRDKERQAWLIFFEPAGCLDVA